VAFHPATIMPWSSSPSRKAVRLRGTSPVAHVVPALALSASKLLRDQLLIVVRGKMKSNKKTAGPSTREP
jgi:hypothetical protein